MCSSCKDLFIHVFNFVIGPISSELCPVKEWIQELGVTPGFFLAFPAFFFACVAMAWVTLRFFQSKIVGCTPDLVIDY